MPWGRNPAEVAAAEAAAEQAAEQAANAPLTQFEARLLGVLETLVEHLVPAADELAQHGTDIEMLRHAAPTLRARITAGADALGDTFGELELAGLDPHHLAAVVIEAAFLKFPGVKQSAPDCSAPAADETTHGSAAGASTNP